MTQEHGPFWKRLPLILLVVLSLNLLLLLYVSFFKRDALRLETLKVGGSDNMQLVQKLYSSDAYKQQQKTAIQQVLDGMKTGTQGDTAQAQAPTPDATATDTTAPSSTIDATTLAGLKKGVFVEGSQNARITILEYSDLLCPFCKRQMDDKVLEQLVQKYNGQVNVIFKHYIVHDGAKKLAEDAQCVGDLAGDKAFYSFLAKTFDLDDKSDSAILGLVKDLGVNQSKFTQCVSSDKFGSFIDASTEWGRTLFGVNGTPGNVIIDNQKGTYTLIAGAYPIGDFEKAIDGILGK